MLCSSLAHVVEINSSLGLLLVISTALRTNSWAKNKLPFFGRSTMYHVDNELAVVESILGVEANTFASLLQ